MVLDEIEIGSRSYNFLEDEESKVIGLDFLIIKVWDGRINRNYVEFYIRYLLESWNGKMRRRISSG